MNVAGSASETKRTGWPAVFRPRFGLASLLALVTLAAVGSWYWWRRPFEVEHEGSKGWFTREYSILWADWPTDTPEVDPFSTGRELSVQLLENASAFQQSSAQTPRAVKHHRVVCREVETVRRLWDGKTIKDGRLVGYDEDGRKVYEAYYRDGKLHGQKSMWFLDGQVREQREYRAGKREGNWVRCFQRVEREPLRIELAKSVTTWKQGLPHGKWEWFDADGKSYAACQFEMGRLIGAPPPTFDRGLGQRLADGGLDDPALVAALLAPNSEVDFIETPLKDAILYLSEMHEMPILLDAKSLEESGVNIDTPVTMTVQESSSLIETFQQMLEPRKLACDYHHRLLRITTIEHLAAADTTGISQIKIPPDSPLAKVWNQKISIDFVETPLAYALGFMEKQVGLEGFLVLEDVPSELHDTPVTITIKGQRFCDILGVLLEQFEWHASLKDESTIAISAK